MPSLAVSLPSLAVSLPSLAISSVIKVGSEQWKSRSGVRSNLASYKICYNMWRSFLTNFNEIFTHIESPSTSPLEYADLDYRNSIVSNKKIKEFYFFLMTVQWKLAKIPKSHLTYPQQLLLYIYKLSRSIFTFSKGKIVHDIFIFHQIL